MTDRLKDHLSDCVDCAEEGVDATRIAALEKALRIEEPATDGQLVARTLVSVRPLLEARSAAKYRRRVAAAIAAGLVPLPLIALYSRWLLGILHQGLDAFFPGGVADVLVGGYTACLLLVISLTYAAIPILADRQPALASRRVVA
jgi:hypothetical protein